MPRLNYHHLYYFWRVANIGHLTQAAEQLHVSQSALSAQIKQLENKIGRTLFEREGRRLVLTDVGRRVQSYAQDIFSTGEELEQYLKSGNTSHTHLNIGFETHLSRNFIEAFITPLFAQDDVSFSLYARTMSDLTEGLLNHELDIALTNRAITNDVQGVLWQNQLVARQSVAIVGPYGQQPEQPFPKGYEDKHWILPARNMGIRSVFESFCATHEYRADIKAEVDDMAMMRLLARDSGFLSVMPPVVVKDEIEAKKLEIYQELPQAYEHFYALQMPRKFIPEVLLHLLRSHQLE
ncbi:LysR family transcriptional regulator [Marinomonas ostreistagni]|uniref:LysR family transcriptional regulator n=1 Tax=Marinomonas ostreistagni TaxID=359209 RepID=A0ABS0ZBD7_9GAMM|nr:LysR family transcriptional regulator [Marinomonas ostreistagni]MBJ7550979.1 LysR family transcriptional regulator [Marinomonas ostreistagni]